MSRVNHNANYMFDVDGETVWEKLRTIRGMLDDRRRAYQHAQLNSEIQGKRIEKEDPQSFEYRKWLIDKDFSDSLIVDCKNEIKFLEAFETFLLSEAEKTRIPGKTDDEMYEINYFYEMETRLARKAQAQIMTRGVLDEELMLRLMKNRPALDICIKQGLLSAQVADVIDTPLLPSYSTHSTLFLESHTTGKEMIEHELPLKDPVKKIN